MPCFYEDYVSLRQIQLARFTAFLGSEAVKDNLQQNLERNKLFCKKTNEKTLY